MSLNACIVLVHSTSIRVQDPEIDMTSGRANPFPISQAQVTIGQCSTLDHQRFLIILRFFPIVDALATLWHSSTELGSTLPGPGLFYPLLMHETRTRGPTSSCRPDQLEPLNIPSLYRDRESFPFRVSKQLYRVKNESAGVLGPQSRWPAIASESAGTKKFHFSLFSHGIFLQVSPIKKAASPSPFIAFTTILLIFTLTSVYAPSPLEILL